MPFIPAAVRRTTAVSLLAVTLSCLGVGAAEATDPPALHDCYQVAVTDPTTGEHPTVDVCPPL